MLLAAMLALLAEQFAAFRKHVRIRSRHSPRRSVPTPLPLLPLINLAGPAGGTMSLLSTPLPKPAFTLRGTIQKSVPLPVETIGRPAFQWFAQGIYSLIDSTMHALKRIFIRQYGVLSGLFKLV